MSAAFLETSRASRIGKMLLRGLLLGLFAFFIFGPLLNLLLWAFAERWYFPNKLPSQFGFSFWDDNPANNNNNAVLRAKWTGNLLPNLYCNPADPNCKP